MNALIWTGFLFLAVGFLTFSLVLIHHWGYYGIKNNKKIFAKSLYFAGAILALAVTAISFALYSSTL